MGPIVLYIHAKIGKILRAVVEKRKESQKIPLLTQHFIPYNLGLRILSEKHSGLKDGPYCPTHSWKKFGGSLEPLLRKGQEGKKFTFFNT